MKSKSKKRPDVVATETFIERFPDAKVRDEDKPEFALQTMSKSILLLAANGSLDLNALARIELAQRGIGHDGKGVSFNQAAQDWLYVEFDITKKLTTKEEAEAFIRGLVDAGLAFHFDDSPSTIISGDTGKRLFNHREAAYMRLRVGELFELLEDPFELLVELTNGGLAE